MPVRSIESLSEAEFEFAYCRMLYPKDSVFKKPEQFFAGMYFDEDQYRLDLFEKLHSLPGYVIITKLKECWSVQIGIHKVENTRLDRAAMYALLLSANPSGQIDIPDSLNV